MAGDRTPLALAVAIIVAGALVAAAIYARPQPTPPPQLRYTITTTAGALIRLDRVTGDMVSCQGGLCARWKADPKHIEWEMTPNFKDISAPSHTESGEQPVQQAADQ